MLPTVYQGNYAPVARKPEEALFPILRQNGIAFYAYSPLAGGFLAKTRAQIEEQTNRWDPNTVVGQIYGTLYNKPSYLDALSKWELISDKSGIPKAELGYRWVAHHSILKPAHGDALIFSGSSLEQNRQTIKGIKRGPLPHEVAQQIDELWDLIKDDAGLDTFNLNNA